MLTTLGALCLLLSADWRNEGLLPGPLSLQHAQLLDREGSKRCASCHAAADQTLVQWLSHATDDDLARPGQTELCLKCHVRQIPRQWATAAHSVDPEKLLTMASAVGSAVDTFDALLGSRSVDPEQALACAACHREHYGATHDLAWMSDIACQACHQRQYGSFATDHPEFTAWPERRRTRIAFDHAAHEAKHFPKEKQVYDCAVCHEQSLEGDFQQTLAYDETCAKCHDKSIATSWDTGVPLLALPMLDIQTLEDEGQGVGQWPDDAAEEFDGPLPPIAKLLLIAEPAAAKALGTLGVEFDFFDVDPDEPEQVEAAAEVVWATKELLFDLTDQGQAAIRRRVESVLDRELRSEELADLVAHLSPENLSVVVEDWLMQLPQEVAMRRGEAVEEPSELEQEPATKSGQDRAEALQRVEAGGWVRDDLTLSIRYHATGHADRWVTAWIEVMAEASSGSQGELARGLLKEVMKPTAAGLCGQCHSVDRRVDGGLEVHWLAKRGGEEGKEFTWFSHEPHLVEASLADCRSCHRTEADSPVMASYVAESPYEFASGFEPLTKQDCAECHNRRASGESCLQCHYYHVGAQALE
ncbi:MAG: hypothetical protein KDA57_05775 [Planctomycetales bacterium]|nr:hypothetical protein [Planctomycetales bacterium]